MSLSYPSSQPTLLHPENLHWDFWVTMELLTHGKWFPNFTAPPIPSLRNHHHDHHALGFFVEAICVLAFFRCQQTSELSKLLHMISWAPGVHQKPQLCSTSGTYQYSSIDHYPWTAATTRHFSSSKSYKRGLNFTYTCNIFCLFAWMSSLSKWLFICQPQTPVRHYLLSIELSLSPKRTLIQTRKTSGMIYSLESQHTCLNRILLDVSKKLLHYRHRGSGHLRVSIEKENQKGDVDSSPTYLVYSQVLFR